jgi:polysaccharide biosynthesis transport protein
MGGQAPVAAYQRCDDGGYYVILSNAARDADGRPHQPGSGNASSRDTKLVNLTTRQLSRGPGSPGSWSLFLIAHARWIVAVTLAVVAAAAAFAFTRTPLYRSEADALVQPSTAEAGAASQEPDMGTEEGVVTSGVVLAAAAQAIGVPVSTLASGLSVTARGSSYVLVISYSSPNPSVAQQRAQAIARAYTSFRSSRASNAAVVATLITPASLPTSPYSPDYLLDIGAALIVGLALAITTAWGRDYLDDRLRGPFDLERQASADVLALIPAFRPKGRAPSRRLAVAVNSGSMVAQAYQGLSKRVLRITAARNSRTFVVTSPAWEDRGTVAANLAAATAQSGCRTVLICADLHSGCAHLLLGGWNDSPGLAGLLEEWTDLDSALRATAIPGLQLLPPGAVPPDSAPLQRHSWLAVVDEIRSRADVLVIEAPPLLASEALPLADGFEVVLLIADARSTTRAQVRAAARELEQERVRLGGCVLVSVGRRRRLRPSRHQSPNAPDEWSHRASSRNSEVSLKPAADAALEGPNGKGTKERQWPNRF